MTKTNKEKAAAFYKVALDLSNQAKMEFGRVDVTALEETLSAYLSVVVEPIEATPEGQDPETVAVSKEILKQMALLASIPLTRLIHSKYKAKR